MLARRRIRHPPSLQGALRAVLKPPGDSRSRGRHPRPDGAGPAHRSRRGEKIFHAGGRAVIRARPQNFPDLEGGVCTAEPCRAYMARIRSHTPAPKHPGRLAFHFYTFSLCFGLFCNLFLDMTKPLQRTYASRQRADTRFSPLSWTHPIRAEAGFGIFRGGGWRCCNPSIQPEGH